MRRISAILFAAFVLVARAETRMYLVNDWTDEQIIRVNASDPYFEMGCFVGWTNGWDGSQLPCRIGVRLADANFTRDGQQVRRVTLPAEIDCFILADGEQGAPIVVSTGFDGYLHFRLRCDDEAPEWLDDSTATWPGMTNRLSITQLLKGRLPHE